MSKRASEPTTTAAVDLSQEPAVAAPATTDVLSGVEFRTPMLQLAKVILGPFLRHGSACTADACACGLSLAVAELVQREMVTQRYGV